MLLSNVFWESTTASKTDDFTQYSPNSHKFSSIINSIIERDKNVPILQIFESRDYSEYITTSMMFHFKTARPSSFFLINSNPRMHFVLRFPRMYLVLI